MLTILSSYVKFRLKKILSQNNTLDDNSACFSFHLFLEAVAQMRKKMFLKISQI